MKKTVVSALSILSFFLFSVPVFSQGGGTKPELVMYRYNSYPTQPSPVLQEDLLGTLKWQGLTGIGNTGSVVTGASIQSFVKAPVSYGALQANMIFRTSGSLGLLNRMIITQNGLVGIGTDDPAYNLHVVGNTHTTGDFYGRIHFDKNIATNDGPNLYIDEAYFELKNRAVLTGGNVLPPSLSAQGGLLSLAPGGTARDHQLFFGDDGIWNRIEDGNAGSWTTNWNRLLTSADINGTKNQIAKFTGPNSLGDSQLFDDGANVRIGSGAFDAAYLLNVNGQSLFNGNTRVKNDLAVNGNAVTDGTSQLKGNVGIATAPSAYQLDVNGTTHISGKVAIGTTNTPGSHALYVGGSIIATEVKVALEPSWPDYVFEPGYDLKPLAEVEKYVRENKHLPGIAPAGEVTQSGLDLGQSQKAQMEKIEELFLHLISLEKRVNELEKQNQLLQTENTNLKSTGAKR